MSGIVLANQSIRKLTHVPLRGQYEQLISEQLEALRGRFELLLSEFQQKSRQFLGNLDRIYNAEAEMTLFVERCRQPFVDLVLNKEAAGGKERVSTQYLVAQYFDPGFDAFVDRTLSKQQTELEYIQAVLQEK